MKTQPYKIYEKGKFTVTQTFLKKNKQEKSQKKKKTTTT